MFNSCRRDTIRLALHYANVIQDVLNAHNTFVTMLKLAVYMN